MKECCFEHIVEHIIINIFINTDEVGHKGHQYKMPKYGDRIFSRHTIPSIARCESVYGEEIFFWSGLIEWVEIKIFEKYGMLSRINPGMHSLE